jgi:amidase
MQEWSISELGKKLASGELTSRQLAEMYLSRIAMVDQGEDGINAVIELNPDALVIAETLDAERAAGKVRGPLHGIPIALWETMPVVAEAGADAVVSLFAGTSRACTV